MTDPTKDFLGAGWKFPPRLDVQGQIELVSQEQDVEEAILMILGTNKGERPMRPEFGSELSRLVFAPINTATTGLAARYVRESLARWEPRIRVTQVMARPDPAHESRLMISIDYSIPATNSDRNLVFPFYTIPGED
ncbi:MAG: GPW/gp25 family protein [Janthinobacterium lividum]